MHSWELLELDFPVMPLCTLIRKECFQRIGLLNRRISSIDDWDIFTRIAELYEVVVIEAVGIYRQPTPFSGQGSSARAAQLGRVARHQLELFRLPRAASASAARRREARARTINRISEEFDLDCRQEISAAGQTQFRRVPTLAVALQLDPMSFIRPGAYLKLAKNLIGDKRKRSLKPQ